MVIATRAGFEVMVCVQFNGRYIAPNPTYVMTTTWRISEMVIATRFGFRVLDCNKGVDHGGGRVGFEVSG